jgi:AraC-like DNA-binding protein
VYRITSPPADLAPFIRFFWGVAGTSIPHARERVVPDGCCELIVHFGAPFSEVNADGKLVVQPRGFLFGQLQSALVLAPGESIGFVAARFHPAGIGTLLGIDPRALGGVAVPLADLFGRAGGESVDRILTAHSIEQGWAVLIGFLRDAARRSLPRTAMLGQLCTLFARPGASVGAAARELSMSTRSLERRFSESVGLAPRHFIRIARVAAAADLLRSRSPSLAGVAQAAGYADQSHFTREFRVLAGVTPGEYRRELGREHASIVP